MSLKLQVIFVRILGLICLGLCGWLLAQLAEEDLASSSWWANNYRLIVVVLIGLMAGGLTLANPRHFVEHMLIAQKRQPMSRHNLPWWVALVGLVLVIIGIAIFRHFLDG